LTANVTKGGLSGPSVFSVGIHEKVKFWKAEKLANIDFRDEACRFSEFQVLRLWMSDP